MYTCSFIVNILPPFVDLYVIHYVFIYSLFYFEYCLFCVYIYKFICFLSSKFIYLFIYFLRAIG